MEEIERLVRKGKELMRQKKWEEARECFRKVLEMKPHTEIKGKIRELDYDCFLMLSDDVPIQSIEVPALRRWRSAKTPRERRVIIAEANTATSAYIEEKSRHFEKQIDEVIASTVSEYEENPRRKMKSTKKPSTR